MTSLANNIRVRRHGLGQQVDFLQLAGSGSCLHFSGIAVSIWELGLRRVTFHRHKLKKKQQQRTRKEKKNTILFLEK